MSDAPRIGIVGATGAVGVEILRVMERRNFPVASLKLLASKRSAGKTLEYKGKPYVVEELTAESFKGVDVAFFSAGATRSREFVPAAKAAGAIVIDNSSAFRMDPNVPLVVPEVNPGDLRRHTGVIANPNCTAAILCTAVWPIHQAVGIAERADERVGRVRVVDEHREVLALLAGASAGRQPARGNLPEAIAAAGDTLTESGGIPA